MVTAISTTKNTKRAPTPTRPPLLPSESDNAIAPPRKPKAREVTSRYMSSSSSCSSSSFVSPPIRSNSPLVTRTVNLNRQKSTPSSATTVTVTPLMKRSQSVERRRQGTPRPNGETPVAQKMLFTSTRSLSVSFQGESFPFQVSKAKPPPATQSLRKGTPERRKVTAATVTTPTIGRGRMNGNSVQTENSNSNSNSILKSMDQHRWPAKSKQNQPNFMNRSLDCGVSLRNSNGTGNNVVRSLRNSLLDPRASHDGTLRLESNKNCGSEPEIETELVPSDNESVTSGSSSGAQCNGGGQPQRASRAIVVPARFWQEATNPLRRQVDLPSPKNGNKLIIPPKLLVQKKSVLDSPAMSPRGTVNNRLQGSPIRSAVRPVSPSKLATPSPWSPSRGVSPSRGRNGVASNLSSRFVNEPSVLSFAVDVPRGKNGENRIVDAHLLRLLHNRLMQWRFVNARADASLSVQTLNAEKSLYDAWVATSKLRESVIAKRTELQMLKQHFKLISILNEQMIYLEDWAILDRTYSGSLSGATEALKASTLRLPVFGGAKIDLLNLKEAICSAMDVMQAMASSICLLLPQVVHVKSLVVEVVNLSAKERCLLDECQDLLSMIRTMQVRESSLISHTIQMKCLPRSQQ
ncbi:QWRF motif-containing protein 2-like [Trifolium pratense]|uniref:QWRF motif-containing protein 2-like n=1 Tax=Trifolium pratense TaxID=57577 RepID=UPI001E69533F|nr:QWRF motif-containing protein 2-like [Trifolium pratense]